MNEGEGERGLRQVKDKKAHGDWAALESIF